MVADYYEMLGLDPGADRAAIEAALRRSQPDWSSRTRHPSKGTLYQSYLDQIPEIRRRLLGDAAERAAYDAERAAARRAVQDAQLDRLQRLVQLRAAKGGLTVTDRKVLLDEAERLGLAKEDLDRLAEPFPPLPEAPAAPPPEDDRDPPVDTIEPAVRRQIRITLEHLKRRDLYDLLGLPRDAPAREIALRASAERRRWMQKAQVTAEKTAWLNAVSLAQSHLTTPAARAKYDRTLGLEAEEEFAATLAFALKGAAGLDDGTRGALLKEATSLGILPARAEILIRRACRRAGLGDDGRAGGGVVVVGNGQADRRWLRCRSCAGLTDYAWAEIHGSGGCRHCRAPLNWECPVCRRPGWVDEPRCHHCKFELANLEPMVRHFEAAQHAHRSRKLEAALAHLRRVQEYAPHHVGARKGVEKILQAIAQVKKLKGLYEAERALGRLVAARAVLEDWSRLVAANDPDVQAELGKVQAGLARAGALATTARKLAARDALAARELFRQAMAIAADLPEVVEGLRLCPPGGPTQLRAEVVGGRVRLRWSAPKPDGLGPVTYRVLRKRQQAPAHAEDGVLLAEVTEVEWQDDTPKPGESFGYAVFAQRHGVSSPLGVSAGPFLAAEDVGDVRVEARSGEVRLSWTTPPGVLGVRVVRKPGAPIEGPRDGIPIEATDDGALDRGLDDGRVYHYGLFALYRGPDGKPHPARGVFVTAVPQPPALPVNDLSLRVEPDGRLRLSWTAPPGGHVRILRSPRPLPLGAGERRSAAEIERAEPEAVWLPEIAPDHAFDAAREVVGVDHYTPVTLAAGQAAVGRAVAFSHVPDLSDLRVSRADRAEPDAVHLRWRWNPQAPHALVVARQGRDPEGPGDSKARSFPVREEEYARQRHFRIELPHDPSAPWHVAVYSVASFEGRRSTSPGLDPTARAVVPGPTREIGLAYDLRPPLLPGRKWSITFRTEPKGAEVPPTVLVAHPRTVPLAPDDGELVARFPAARDGQRLTFRRPPGRSSLRMRLFPDPSANPEGQAPLRLRHPEAGGTRV